MGVITAAEEASSPPSCGSSVDCRKDEYTAYVQYWERVAVFWLAFQSASYVMMRLGDGSTTNLLWHTQFVATLLCFAKYNSCTRARQMQMHVDCHCSTCGLYREHARNHEKGLLTKRLFYRECVVLEHRACFMQLFCVVVLALGGATQFAATLRRASKNNKQSIGTQ